MVREYGDAYDQRMMRGYLSAERKKLSENTRKFADCHIKVGRYHHRLPRFGWMSMEIDYSGVEWIDNADSIKFLSKYYRSARYFEVSCHPGIRLTIKPFSCELYANRQYANGAELRVLDSAVAHIEQHILGLHRKFNNRITLR